MIISEKLKQWKCNLLHRKKFISYVHWPFIETISNRYGCEKCNRWKLVSIKEVNITTSNKIQRLVCKILGHKFGGYIPPTIQELPHEFYCRRCEHNCYIAEGWK